mmetsp:Transcript_10391/g.45099  ORF Transcript_10391/g.45099 Transcript_10391/m.45099 type:complete len:270 (+) Transcript_10391:444-1253(+)
MVRRGPRRARRRRRLLPRHRPRRRRGRPGPQTQHSRRPPRRFPRPFPVVRVVSSRRDTRRRRRRLRPRRPRVRRARGAARAVADGPERARAAGPGRGLRPGGGGYVAGDVRRRRRDQDVGRASPDETDGGLPAGDEPGRRRSRALGVVRGAQPGVPRPSPRVVRRGRRRSAVEDGRRCSPRGSRGVAGFLRVRRSGFGWFVEAVRGGVVSREPRGHGVPNGVGPRGRPVDAGVGVLRREGGARSGAEGGEVPDPALRLLKCVETLCRFV